MNAPVPLRRFTSRIFSAGPSTRPGDWIRDPGRGCADSDPELFFPETRNANTLIKAARAICAGCPFRVECSEYAIAEPMLKGVWGGTTEIDRRRIRHRRRLEST
jgi:WhiB family redox-sensing transcriptional regulator